MKSLSVLSIWMFYSLVDSVQIVCDDTTPAHESTVKCECTDVSGTGVDWWKGTSIISTCVTVPMIKCVSSQTGYDFQVNSSSKYFMEINSHSYLHCDEYRCSDLDDSSTSPTLDISISNITLNLTKEIEMTESSTNITVLSECLFISSDEEQANIKTIWYTILNGSTEIYTSSNSTTIFEETCQKCTGVRARRLKVVLFYKESESNSSNESESESVKLMLRIYDQSDPSNTQNITTSNNYTISLAKDDGEDEEETCCITTVYTMLSLWLWFQLLEIIQLYFECTGKCEVQMKIYLCFFTSVFFGVFSLPKNGYIKNVSVIIVIVFYLVDITLVSVALVLSKRFCKSEEEECILGFLVCFPIALVVNHLLRKLFIFIVHRLLLKGYCYDCSFAMCGDQPGTDDNDLTNHQREHIGSGVTQYNSRSLENSITLNNTNTANALQQRPVIPPIRTNRIGLIQSQ